MTRAERFYRASTFAMLGVLAAMIWNPPVTAALIGAAADAVFHTIQGVIS